MRLCRVAEEGKLQPRDDLQLPRLDLRPSLHALGKGFHKDCIQRKSIGRSVNRSPMLTQAICLSIIVMLLKGEG